MTTTWVSHGELVRTPTSCIFWNCNMFSICQKTLPEAVRPHTRPCIKCARFNLGDLWGCPCRVNQGCQEGASVASGQSNEVYTSGKRRRSGWRRDFYSQWMGTVTWKQCVYSALAFKAIWSENLKSLNYLRWLKYFISSFFNFHFQVFLWYLC